jgi:histone H2A
MQSEEFLRKQKAFHENPGINPDTGKRLLFGKGPYLKFIEIYGPIPTKQQSSPTKQPSPKQQSPPKKVARPKKSKVQVVKTIAKNPGVIAIENVGIIPRDINYNIVINTPPVDLLALYQTNSAYRSILDSPDTLDFLYNKYLQENYDKESKQYFIQTAFGKKVYPKNKSFNNFLKIYSNNLTRGAGLSIDIMNVYLALREMSQKFHYNRKVDLQFAIRVSAVLEYLIAEMLELAGNVARENNKVRVTDRHLVKAIESDDELKKTFPEMMKQRKTPSFQEDIKLIVQQVHPEKRIIQDQIIYHINYLLYYIMKKMLIDYENNLPFHNITTFINGELGNHALNEAQKAYDRYYRD